MPHPAVRATPELAFRHLPSGISSSALKTLRDPLRAAGGGELAFEGRPADIYSDVILCHGNGLLEADMPSDVHRRRQHYFYQKNLQSNFYFQHRKSDNFFENHHSVT